MDLISIITINYNCYLETTEFLDSIRNNLTCRGYSYEMIVVDNASTTDDVTLLKNRYSWVKVISSSQNRGFSGGNNLGIEHASGNYYLFINNDVIIDHDIVIPLLNRFRQSDKIGVVTPKILDFDTSRIIYAGSKPLGKFLIRIHYYDDEVSACKSFPIPYAPGTAMLVKKEVVDKVGFWPEIYFLYEEELDWCLSIGRHGYEIWYDSNASIYHKGSMTTGKNSPLVQYYTTRNRLLIFKRNLRGRYKYCSIIFTLGVSIPQRCLKYFINQQYNLLRATLLGAVDFLCGTFYQRLKSF
ncbi:MULTISPECIES: glycosyltransferase family 2 protein [Parabacteroides]|uniref:glycosyltransferase family 2 protein n=1 Tax=Parabacteroides TaxID=375288 RepID=UPI000F006550|nr:MULTISPECIES: glycosyltransferase family 2 protein [Parabacteroides]RHR93381.1 glycosyltransferase family 2 protein [Parabacteroides sp. AF14-59]